MNGGGERMTRASYTVDFKLSVVEWVRSGEKSLREASKTFGVDRKCIRQWVRESANLGSARLRQGPHTRKLHGGRGPLSQELDRLVLGYLLERRRHGADVDDQELRQKAVEGAKLLDLAEFKASPSWLRGWKARNGVSEPRLTQENAEVLVRQAPVGSALVSHVCLTDSVALSEIQHHEKETASCHQSELFSNQSTGNGHMISHVITPDHTYSRRPPSEFVSPAELSFTGGTSIHSNTTDLSMGGHLLESSNQLLLNDPNPQYCSIQSMCIPSSDPVMSSTHVEHYTELDIGVPLEPEEVLISGVEVGNLPATSSLSSLSPPKRSTLDTRLLLWPALGCNQTSPVTFPEFHDFTDALTGLLANRRSEPVFPARPEILMSNSELS